MPEVTNFNVGGQTIGICDPTARQKEDVVENAAHSITNDSLNIMER